MDPLRLVDDDAEPFLGVLSARIVRQVLRHHQNPRERIADLVGNARSEGADRRQAVLVRDVALELSERGDVLDDEDAALLRLCGDDGGLRSELDLSIFEVVLSLDDGSGWLVR